MIYFLAFILASSLCFPVSTFAQSSTPTSANTIQAIREAVQQKVKEKLSEIVTSGQTKKAFIGTIIQVDKTSLTVEYQGSTQQITITEDVVIANSLGTKIGLDKLKVAQDVVIIGLNDNATNAFQVKRVVLTDLKKIALSRTVIVGKIVDISKTSSLITIVSDTNKNNIYQVKTDSKTELINKNKDKLKSSDIGLGKRVIGVLSPDIKMSKTYYANKLISLDLAPEASPTAVKTP